MKAVAKWVMGLFKEQENKLEIKKNEKAEIEAMVRDAKAI